MLAIPIFNQDQLFAVLYCEHEHIRGAFSRSVLPAITAISTQFAISYESLRNVEKLIASKRQLEELSTVRSPPPCRFVWLSFFFAGL